MKRGKGRLSLKTLLNSFVIAIIALVLVRSLELLQRTVVALPVTVTAEQQQQQQQHETRGLRKNATLFFCGYGAYGFEDHLFPEYASSNKRNWTTGSSSRATADDLMLYGLHGPCDHSTVTFPGKILYHSGEPVNENSTGDRRYQIGANADDGYHMMRIYPITRVFSMHHFTMAQRAWIWDPSQRRTSTKAHFLIYTARHCVDFRDEAFAKLAAIQQPAHQGGACPKKSPPNVIKVTLGERVGYMSNYHHYGKYRFCLVLENTKHDGYITEKILLAFMGGCIPIYWGTTEVFRMFNPNAFVYYDVHDPQPALERVRYLEYNATAYDEVMAEPILANGNATLEEYFSMMDELGGGKIKQKIRHLLGLSG
jgi:hypothetical protein